MAEEKDLSERRIPKYWNDLYIELLANPLDKRTDKQFCEENGLSISALQQWKARYRKSIFTEVDKRRREFINELRTQAFKDLASKMGKDSNALKMALQITGDLVEKSETKVEMNYADKLRRIRTLQEGIKSRKKAWESAGIDEKDSSSDEAGSGTSELGRTE